MEIDTSAGVGQPRASTRQVQEDDQSMGRDDFMKLLVTQMQNQDPLDPMDAREMVSQLSELASVDELRGINHRMAVLEIGVAGMANTQTAGLVGKTVSADGAGILLPETGSATGVYELDARASEVEIVIRDAAGRTVRTLEAGEGFPGGHTFDWDGLDDTGERLPSGRYSVEISAKDSAGNPVAAETKVSGLVTGVSYDNGYPELIIGEARVLLGDVTSIEL